MLNMPVTRRKFLRHVSLLTAAATAAARRGHAAREMHAVQQRKIALLDTNALVRYVDPLPIPGIMQKSGVQRSKYGVSGPSSSSGQTSYRKNISYR